MSFDMLINIVLGVVVLLVVLIVVLRRMPRRLKHDYYMDKWKELQGYCKDKKTWPTALEEADKLLDKALKKRKFKGKSMGERMVSAQRIMTNNDGMWFAHNLAKKVIADPKTRLKDTDVKMALVGFRQSLKDLGALKLAPKPDAETKDEDSRA